MMEFRLCTPDDAVGLCRCVEVVARERRYLAAVCGFPEDETRAFLHKLVENGGIQVLALDERAVVGWCDVMPLPHEGMRHVGRLGMGLRPAYRGQGLGKRLLRETIDRAFATRLRRIELDVFASNLAAQRLYARAGFVTEGRRRHARILDGVEDDILVMGLLREEWPHETFPGADQDRPIPSPGSPGTPSAS
ncbi:MAG TPA: GNAT family protein [Gemmataceae bacterium]